MINHSLIFSTFVSLVLKMPPLGVAFMIFMASSIQKSIPNVPKPSTSIIPLDKKPLKKNLPFLSDQISNSWYAL